MSYIWKKHKQYKKNKRVVPGVVSTYSGIGARGSNGALGSLGAAGATVSVSGWSSSIPVFPQEYNNVGPTQCPKCKKKVKAGKKHKCDSGLRGLLKNV